MENEERLKFKLRVEQIKKNLIEFRKCPQLTQ